MSKKILLENYPNATVKKVLFKSYNYVLTLNETVYYIKVLNVSKNNILSINSKYVWEIRTGKPNGISFKTSSKTMLDMTEFNELKNKIIVFKGKPYKVLKYINESEVVDISDNQEIFDIKIFNSIKKINL